MIDSATKEKMKIVIELKAPMLTRDKIICPATILAAKRTDKVIGRIINLTVSIKTMNGMRIDGQPNGTRWENILSKFNQPVIISLIHKGRAKDKVSLICLVAVNVNGKIPTILNDKIKKNNGIKNKNK